MKSQRGKEEREGKEDERQARKQQQSSNRKLAGTNRKWNTQRGVIFPQHEDAPTSRRRRRDEGRGSSSTSPR